MLRPRTIRMSAVTPIATKVIPLPGAAPSPPPPSPACFVETTPTVGYSAITLTYYDAERVPRIQVVLDLTVPDVDWWRRFMKKVGDDLPPVTPSRPPLLGPRLLP